MEQDSSEDNKRHRRIPVVLEEQEEQEREDMDSEPLVDLAGGWESRVD